MSSDSGLALNVISSRNASATYTRNTKSANFGLPKTCGNEASRPRAPLYSFGRGRLFVGYFTDHSRESARLMVNDSSSHVIIATYVHGPLPHV